MIVMHTNELFTYNDITQESHCVEQKSLEITVDGNGRRGAERTPCIRRLNLKEGLQRQRAPKATADDGGFHEDCSNASTVHRKQAESST